MIIMLRVSRTQQMQKPLRMSLLRSNLRLASFLRLCLLQTLKDGLRATEMSRVPSVVHTCGHANALLAVLNDLLHFFFAASATLYASHFFRRHRICSGCTMKAICHNTKDFVNKSASTIWLWRALLWVSNLMIASHGVVVSPHIAFMDSSPTVLVPSCLSRQVDSVGQCLPSYIFMTRPTSCVTDKPLSPLKQCRTQFWRIYKTCCISIICTRSPSEMLVRCYEKPPVSLS
jgi:hypothetical protein